jgi:hypothetical protein
MFFSSEILRVVDSLQLTAHKKVATPADWEVILKKQFNDIVAVALIHGTFIFRIKNSSLRLNEDQIYKFIRHLHYKNYTDKKPS